MALSYQGPTEFGGLKIQPYSNAAHAAAAGYKQPVISQVPIIPQTSIAGQTLTPLLNTLQGYQRPTIENTPSLSSQFAGQAPVPMVRPGNEYYQNLFNAKLQPIQSEFFDPGGTSDQAVGEANRRGFLTQGPSGVAGQLYEQTVTNPYAKQVGNVQNQVNVIRGETDLQLSQFDAERQDRFRSFIGDLQTKDKEYGIRKAESQANIDNTFLSLEADIRQAIASGATQEEINRLTTNVQMFNTLINRENSIRDIESRDRQSSADAYTNLLNTPGGLSPSTPFEALGIPRPLGQSSDDASGETTISNQTQFGKSWDPQTQSFINVPGTAPKRAGDRMTYNGREFVAVSQGDRNPQLHWVVT